MILTQTPRRADVDTVIPLSDPVIGKNGRPISELFVPAGTLVVVNNVGVNYDPSVWGPDAHEWKPERWFDLPPAVAETKYPSVYSHMCVTVCLASRAFTLILMWTP